MKRIAIAVVLAAVCAAPAGAASPKVLRVVPTGFSVVVEPATLASGTYTVQVHNVAATTVVVRIGRLAAVTVAPNGWQFPTIRVVAGTAYRITATAPGGASWAALVSVTGR